MTLMPTYHAPTFEPTVDELGTLKRLEMGDHLTVPEAVKDHVSARLLERGYIATGAAGALSLTSSGLQLIRRQDN
jgi:hypothetical protein